MKYALVAFQILLAASVIVIPLLAIFLPPSEKSICPKCHEKSDIFSHGGGEKTSVRYNVPLLGKIPIDISIRECGDAGMPIVEADPKSPQSEAFVKIAQSVASRISIEDLS